MKYFKRPKDEGDDGRCGVWLMTGMSPYHGVFYHGDREEMQNPRYNIDELTTWSDPDTDGFLDVVEIDMLTALNELTSWNDGRMHALAFIKLYGSHRGTPT